MKDKYFTLWLTGLPCSGKTTIAEELEKKLKKEGFPVAHLDGDDVRRGLNSDLGFSKEDRHENLRRIGYVSELFNQKGNYVIASFVSPLEEYRALLKDTISDFKLVYVNTPLEECVKRDVKGMYAKALRGEMKGFTGIDAPFEEPKDAGLIVYTKEESLQESVEKIYQKFFK
jgi:adenylylsulfate kinase